EGLGDLGDRETVWMSHGDKVTAIPLGFEVVAASEGSPFAVIADEARRFYGIQFHPEVAHTPRGSLILRNFTHRIAGLKGDWTMASDPETKRKTIGRLFIEVFDKESAKIQGAAFLAQGTLYPDVIESVSARGGPSAVIKSHHNVGGLPDYMKLKLVEPLRELFKDE